MMQESSKKDVIIKADSLAEAYAMAFEEVGAEFDVLEIKKVDGGAFGSVNIQIRVAPVKQKKAEQVAAATTQPVEPVVAPKVKDVEVKKAEAPVQRKVVRKDALKINKESRAVEPKLVLKKASSIKEAKTVLRIVNPNEESQRPNAVLKKEIEIQVQPEPKKEMRVEKKKEEKVQKVEFVKPVKLVNNWEDAVVSLREAGFNESNIVKMLSEIKTTKKHLKLKPLSLVEDRLVYHCVGETKASKTINVLLAKPSLSSSAGISAYLFSKYAKQGLSSNKIVLTNSVADLRNVLGKDFLKILRVELLEVDQAQDWLSSSSLILSQDEVCCVFFQKNDSVLEVPEVPDAMGAVSYTRLVKWSEEVEFGEVEFLKEHKAQLFVTGLEENSIGSLLKPSLDLEIPTGFVLRGKDFLSGLIHSSDLIREVIEEMSGTALVEERKVG